MLRKMMLRKILLLSTFLALAYARVPRPLMNVAVPLPDGKSIQLSQYRGKVMLLALISTQCKDCIKSIELMGRAQRDYGPRGFQAIAIAVNNDASQETRAFVDRYRPPFPVGFLDRDTAVKLADLGPEERPFVPVFLFVDRRGLVRFQYQSNEALMKDNQEKSSRSIVDGLLKQ